MWQKWPNQDESEDYFAQKVMQAHSPVWYVDVELSAAYMMEDQIDWKQNEEAGGNALNQARLEAWFGSGPSSSWGQEIYCRLNFPLAAT